MEEDEGKALSGFQGNDDKRGPGVFLFILSCGFLGAFQKKTKTMNQKKTFYNPVHGGCEVDVMGRDGGMPLST